MRWPWSRREDDAKRRAEEAAISLEEVQERWEQVHAAVRKSREHGVFAQDHLTRLFIQGRGDRT